MMEGFFESMLFAMVIGAALPLGYWMYRLGYGSAQSDYAKKFHANTSCPPPDDAIKSAKEVKSFLYDICWEMGIDKNEKGVDRAFGNVDKELANFIRYFHALGLELVIRKVADYDIEEVEQDLYEFQNEADLRLKKHLGIDPESLRKKRVGPYKKE